jgi:hypothetical protein
MSADEYRPSQRGRIVFYYACALCVVIALMLLFSSWRSKPSVETITVDSHRTTPVSFAPIPGPSELPAADRDIETAGDRVAAAVIYLKRKQSGPALNALEQATAATERALARKPDQSKIRDQLLATNRQIETVKDLIRSGRIGTATTTLKEVDQRLEAVSY